MSYQQKIVRTLRLRNRNVRGTLAKVCNTISENGGDIGDIKTLSLGELNNIRDISIITQDEASLANIIASLQKISEVEIEQIIDDVLELHQGGKLVISPRYPVKSIDDLRRVYTPGVASVSKLIADDPRKARMYTVIPRTVAICTNGSRVLGLGNIGPVAAMPVMEGKAALFTQFAKIAMIPVLINTLNPEEFIQTVVKMSPTFGAIQLEDIRTPDCYEIEEKLIGLLDIPVMHDDQHGTATVTLAAAINACKYGGKKLSDVKVGQVGLGAAGSAIARLIMSYTGQTVYGADPRDYAQHRHKGFGGKILPLDELMKSVDLVISTTGQKDLIQPAMIRKGQIILALSNPHPEIAVESALKAGAAFASDGAQVNNLLGFPGLLKGACDCRASRMTQAMYLAAADMIASLASPGELVPSAIDPLVHLRVAQAVAKAAIASGVARHQLDSDYFTNDRGW